LVLETHIERASEKAELSPETISLMKKQAANNRLCGAERIRGELLTLGIRRSQANDSAIYAADSRHFQLVDRPGRPSYAIMWQRFGPAMRLQVTDLFFRPLFAFFLIELKSRKVIHMNMTRPPTDSWVARTAARGDSVWVSAKYLLRDNDRKFGSNFARVATTSGIKVLRTPYQTRAGQMLSANVFWEV
jgi:putative transposase